jgi:antitoxin component of MazEF toxin-antitoxin module
MAKQPCGSYSFDDCKKNQLHSGSTIKLSSDDGQIVIAPVREQRYRLADLLEGVTHENIHGEIACGDAVGREEW